MEQNHPNSKKIRVQIVDEVRLVRDGLASLLSKSPDLPVTGLEPKGMGIRNHKKVTRWMSC